MTKYQAEITFDFEVDPDECDPEVFVVNEFFTNPEAFDYTLVVVEDGDEDPDPETFESALWRATAPPVDEGRWL